MALLDEQVPADCLKDIQRVSIECYLPASREHSNWRIRFKQHAPICIKKYLNFITEYHTYVSAHLACQRVDKKRHTRPSVDANVNFDVCPTKCWTERIWSFH